RSRTPTALCAIQRQPAANALTALAWPDTPRLQRDRCRALQRARAAPRAVWCDWPFDPSQPAIARARSAFATPVRATPICAGNPGPSFRSAPATSPLRAMAWDLDALAARCDGASTLLQLFAGRRHEPQRRVALTGTAQRPWSWRRW